MSQMSVLLNSSNLQNSSQYYFSIEGNIGCGKSTFLSLLKETLPDVKWIQEPINQWQNINGKKINILESFYKQPTRWGFTFQAYAIFSRIKALNQAIENFPGRIIITQRSMLADKHVFSQLMSDLGYMDQCQLQIFKSFYENFQKMSKVKNIKIIYLRCQPKKCHERTKIRQRLQQKEIDLQYLQLVHYKHEKWIKQLNPENVLILDTTEDFKDDENKIKEMLSKLKDFISHR